jgi:glycosyltransferase involved in cell wall biosynthesis
MKKIDFLFITGSTIPSPSQARGGGRVISVLVSKLRENGFNTAILQVEPTSLLAESVQRYIKENGLSVFIRLMKSESIFGASWPHLFFQRLRLEVIPRLVARNNSMNVDSVPVEVFDSIEDLKCYDICRSIATLWPAVFMLDQIKSRHKYHLALHDEDSPEATDLLYPFAKLAYSSIGVTKIVGNSHLKHRFPTSIQIPVSIDPIFRLTNPIKARHSKKVLFPLRKFRIKGGEYMIKAAEILNTEMDDVVLESFGDYHGRIPGFINHHGVVSKPELVRLYNEASIFVLPSVVEGFGLPAAEAMACGDAVISTSCIGPLEYIINGTNGIIVPPKDPVAIFRAVKLLLSNDSLRIRLAENGCNTISRFTDQSMYQSFISRISNYEGIKIPQ